MTPSSPNRPAPAPQPLAGRIEYALDYLTQLRDRYQERLRLPEDNAWREGARETIGILTPAITLLQEALRLARRQHTETKSGTPLPDSETSRLFFEPAKELIQQSRTQYASAYFEACCAVGSNGERMPYDSDRIRAKNVFHLIGNTFNRVLYRGDL